MMRVVAVAIAVLVLLYAGAGAMLFAVQRSLVFANDKTEMLPAEAGLPGAEVHRLTTADGVDITAWLVRHEGPRLVIYFHGNGGSLAWRGERIRQLRDLGVSVLAIDYRGFGGSAGRPTEAGLKQDADAAYDFARRLGYAPAQILIYGESLGTGVAVTLASRREVAAVILDAPFSSIVDVAGDRYWMFPVKWLLRDSFRSDLLIGQIRAPILMLHGTDDRVVPIKFGRRLLAKAGANATFVTIDGGDHVVFGEGEAREKVASWLARLDGRSSGARG